MKCPRCGLIVTDQVPQCRGCGFSLEDLDRRAGRLPERTGFVSDHAGLLSPEERAALEQRLARFHEENGGEIVVATVATTRPVKPAEYVFWLFNRWNVGGPEHAGYYCCWRWPSAGSNRRSATRGSRSSPTWSQVKCWTNMSCRC